MNTLTPIQLESLEFRYFFDETIRPDRMAKFFKTYYGRLFFARGFVAEKLGQSDEASVLYEKASQFLHDNPAFLMQVNEALLRMSKNISNQ
jgi:hypothetical protein